MTDRHDVVFDSGDSFCAAWLYLPEGWRPAPVILLGHGLGCVRDMGLDAYARRFSGLGYACLVFDYRHFGASGGNPRQLLDVDRQLEDWASALDFLRARTDVDADRIILWGSSFGAGHAIVTAARDRRIAAVVAQCPFTDGLASTLAMSLRSALAVTVLSVRDVLGARLGRAPVMVATAGPYGSAALLASHDSEQGYLELVPPEAPFRNEVAARIALRILRHRPGRRAAQIEAPALFCICDADSVAPAKASLRHLRRARRGEIRRYPDGHFAIHVGDGFERAIADQIDFVTTHVPVG
ncbi:alpha/beta fold hydrolase [Rhodococcus maanshanensis]|uniref:alpha/beta hydrolase n=1 Tax=Rhodococcus maanshanensis TaxID=183556 RepID=UPI0022B3BE3D|nr:alpha/beta fold hydrolase [Rhodococcus maanshanensis]MCZ4556743.1 alpha/beta fold hydrolase [Rhodococcus maanshanensis]